MQVWSHLPELKRLVQQFAENAGIEKHMSKTWRNTVKNINFVK